MHRGRKNRFDNMGPSMLVPQVVTLPTNRKPPSHLGEIEVGIGNVCSLIISSGPLSRLTS